MRVIVNGEACEVSAGTLQALLDSLDLRPATVATALNGDFVARSRREAAVLRPDDRIEIVAPMQGG